MSSALGLPSQFQPYQIAITTISSIYLALFVMVSNHYVFKPKVQHLFIHSIITSKSFYQFLIDFLTNLTQLTFTACSIFLINSDDSLSVMIYSDMSWCGILLAIVAFRNIQAKNEPNSRLIMLKNIVFLLIVYAGIAFHYVLGIFYITFGIVLLLLYFTNLIINEFEEKFILSMEMLFGYKPDKQLEEEYKPESLPITPQYLSKKFPVTSQQLSAKLKTHERQLRNIKLQTRRSMVQNLLKMSLVVHISKQKLNLKAKRDVKYYYGVFNGTVTQKSKKLILQKQPTKQQPSPEAPQFSYTVEQQQDNSAIFYIFPVKIFQHSKILSIMFSILINFGLGILLSLSVNIASTLNKRYFLQIVYGLLLLPLTPSIGKQDFLNSMTLSSLWKYCLYGIFLTIYCFNQNSGLSFNFATNNQLIFAPIFQLIALILSTFFTLSRKPSSYSFSFVWLFSIGASCLMIFKFC